jgi:predicted transcriptional regulator of viral defense system
MKTSPRGLSDKEMKIMSYLELEGKRFFTKDVIRKFFKSRNELNVYIHRLKEKRRIVRINKEKYYLIPIQAYKGWVEHPFIVADEMFNGKDYYIGGKAAANYWGLIDQIPRVIDVFSTKKQGESKILGSIFRFRRIRRMLKSLKRKIKDHDFLIATKEESEKWRE